MPLDDLTQLIREHKDVPCTDCRVRYPHYTMEFDHVVGTKLFGLARWKEGPNPHTRQEVLAEMAKCEVVCSNCHRHRTWLRRVTIERYGRAW